MKINRRKLPVKYALEIYQELPGYPSSQDFEYLLITALQEKELLEKDFTAEKVWPTLKHHMGIIQDARDFLEELAYDPNSRDVKITKSSGNSYRVTSHSWM